MTELEKKAAELQTKLDAMSNMDTEFKAAKETIAELQTKNADLLKLMGDRKEGDTLSFEQKFAALDKQVTDFGLLLKANKEDEANEFKTLGDSLMDLTKKDSPFMKLGESIVESKDAIVNKTFEIKANVLTTALTGDRQRSIIEAGVDKPVAAIPFMRQIIPNVPTSSPVIYWTERKTHVDGTGGVAEGAAAGIGSSTWEEKNRKVVKRGVTYKYSNESFSDIPQLIADLRQDVVRDMELDIDNQILNGDGTGNNFYGIISDSTAFSAATVDKAASIVKCNIADLIKCMVLQAELSGRMPTHALLSPIDFTTLELEKNADGDYILPPFMTADGRMISGVSIIKNRKLAKNKCLVLDRNAVRFYIAKDMSLEVYDQNSDDAEKDMKTVCLRFRGQVRVRANDKLGIIYEDDMASTITALTYA